MQMCVVRDVGRVLVCQMSTLCRRIVTGCCAKEEKPSAVAYMFFFLSRACQMDHLLFPFFFATYRVTVFVEGFFLYCFVFVSFDYIDCG